MSDWLRKWSDSALNAYSQVMIRQEGMMANNGSFSKSLGDLRQQLQELDEKRSKALTISEIVGIDKQKAKIKEFMDGIDKESTRRNNKVDIDEKINIALPKIWEGGATLLKMAADIEQTQVSFQRLTGSATTAKALIGSLQELGAHSPFKSTDLMENAQQLLEVGVATANIVPTLGLLGDVSGGNKEKLDQLTATYTKVQEDGKLTKTTLAELAAAGFNPLEEMSRSSGIAVEKLQRDLDAGKISAGHLTQALQSATGPGGEFFGLMQQQSDTAVGRWNQFNERLQTAGATLGTTLLPIASDFVNNILMPMAEWLGTAAHWIQENSNWIGLLATFIGGVVLGYKLWMLAQTGLNLVMGIGFSTTGLVIGAVVGLIAGVVYLWNKFEGFRGVVMGAWEGLKAFGTLIKDFIIDRIKGVISGVGGLGQALMYMFKGEWSKAWEVGKAAVSDLTGVSAAKNAADNWHKVGEAGRKGYQEGVNAKPIELNFLKNKPYTPPKLPSGGPGFTGLGNTPEANTALGGNAKEKASGITGGGNRNINISLQKLFDNINIHTTTVHESVQQMEDMVTDALLRVLNSANAIQ